MLMLGEIFQQQKNKKKNKVEKHDYEKPVSECKKLHSIIKSVVERNINTLSQKEQDNVRIEYGEIINESVITKGDDVRYDVCYVYNSQKVPDRKRAKFTKRRIS